MPDLPKNQTRSRIIDAARVLFAELGYSATTNRAIADAVGITTAALYYHFDAKVDIHRAVAEDVRTSVDARLREALEDTQGFVQRIAAIFNTSHRINVEDPSIGAFLSSSRIDRQRDHELVTHSPESAGDRMYASIVDQAIGAGEIDPSKREAVRCLLIAISVGLTDGFTGTIEDQRSAIDGFLEALETTHGRASTN